MTLDRAAMRALAYAAALSQPVLALHVSPTSDEADRFLGCWRAWGDHRPLEVVVRHRWHRILNDNMARRLRRSLQTLPGVVVTSVPFHLED